MAYLSELSFTMRLSGITPIVQDEKRTESNYNLNDISMTLQLNDHIVY